MIWVGVFTQSRLAGIRSESVTSAEYDSLDAAKESNLRASKIQRLRVCIKCGHPECPYCGDSCDEIIGDDYDSCCDGLCTYAESGPYAAEININSRLARKWKTKS